MNEAAGAFQGLPPELRTRHNMAADIGPKLRPPEQVLLGCSKLANLVL